MASSSRRRFQVVMGASAITLVVAAVWLLMETRPHTAGAESSATARAAVPSDASGAARVRTAPPVMPSPDAAVVVHQTPAEREAAKAQRTEWVRSTVSSPRGREDWTDQGQALIDEIGKRAAYVEDNGCYLQGCTATYTFPSRAAYDAVYGDVISADSYSAWKGGKRWSTPEEQPDGRIIVALVLYRPN